MRVRYVKNDVSNDLPSSSESIEEYVKYLHDTFSFPEDENANIELHFIIPNYATMAIPTILLVPFRHKNPKIRIKIEFYLTHVQAMDKHDNIITYRA